MIPRLFEMLDGKRTYLVALALIAEGAFRWLSGDAALGDITTQVLEGLGLAALRSGVKKGY